MRKLFDRYGNHIGSIDDFNGSRAKTYDAYGNHTGYIERSNGSRDRILDEYGNHTGYIERTNSSRDRILDEYGNHTGYIENSDGSSGRFSDEYGNRSGHYDSSENYAGSIKSNGTPTFSGGGAVSNGCSGCLTWIVGLILIVILLNVLHGCDFNKFFGIDDSPSGNNSNHIQNDSIINNPSNDDNNDNRPSDNNDNQHNKSDILLSDLDYINSDGVLLKWVDSAKDNFGNEYSPGITLAYGYELGERYEGWREYHLGGSYSALSGEFVLAYHYRNSEDSYDLEIYGDDTLLYSSSVTTGSEPRSVFVDLSGVQRLKVLLRAPGNWYPGWGAPPQYEYAYLVDAVLQK